MKQNVENRGRISKDFQPPDCDDHPAARNPVPAGPRRDQCTQRASSIQRTWAAENQQAGADAGRRWEAERRAQTALRELFQTVCANQPDAATWVMKANAALSNPSGDTAGGGGNGAGTRTGYAPIPKCLSIVRATDSNFTWSRTEV